MKNNLELRGIKIRINSICPAGVETPLVLEAAKLFYSMPQPIIDAVTASSSTEVMKPEFIAEGIMELITDASKNGAILMVVLLLLQLTGAAGGIGLATSRLLLQSGAKVGAVDKSSGLKSICNALGEEFGTSNIACLPCDVSDDDALKNVFKETSRQFGSLDIVINNAGIADERYWKKQIKVNLQSVINGTYYAMELMSPDKGGVIVNVSSMAGLHPVSTGPVYSAVKHGVVAFTRAMKENVAEKGIRINCICPYFVDTTMGRAGLKALPEAEANEVLKNGILKPEFIAKGIMDLITDTSRNGAILRANPWQGLMYQRYKEDMKSKL
uniref:15-hydroxyprostaglandin dehydrogenase [NAD(+)] n=1 Tax=Amphimedon queenslandica TaxID=400682 RepID=A0A1X7TVP8_AMPQE